MLYVGVDFSDESLPSCAKSLPSVVRRRNMSMRLRINIAQILLYIQPTSDDPLWFNIVKQDRREVTKECMGRGST
ncbi:hypothetical protein O6P43_019829 [Quillaja saponaria]|uniref:Uncharacterized protein n=1 Tax=Quillaja saponaria TaxID=32244 RepID=A0AAD7LL04_QUISA|nr:hypothetical protein O6P43_019829 [Quillaja saponaria]